MKTAEQIVAKYFNPTNTPHFKTIVKVVNEARREALEEAANELKDIKSVFDTPSPSERIRSLIQKLK